MSLGHPAGQTRVYRPVSQAFPVVYKKNREKRVVLPGHQVRVPGILGQPAVCQIIYSSFSYVPFLLSKTKS